MNNPILLLAASLALIVIGWMLRKAFERFAPTEKAVALKAATKALSALSALQSPAADAVAQAAAAQARETALMAAFKEAAAKL